jgi:guanine deaminase
MTGPDAEFLREAVALAQANAERGEAPFGAVVTRDEAAIASAANAMSQGPDPTAHAEVMAIRAACRALGTLGLEGATVYASCEPCPMCLASAVMTGVSRVVYAAPKESAEWAGFVFTEPAAALHEASYASRPVPIEHLPIEGADEPFARYVEVRARS